MTDHSPSRFERPIDLGVLHADDLLLDALGRGDPPPSGDGLADALAAWRADLADPPEPAPVNNVMPISRARRRRGVRLAVAAAALVATIGGTGIAAAQAGPDSPLWPITHLVNPDRADVLDAESAIADARRAVTERRRDDARRLLDRADALISRVRDPRDAARLRAELDQVRHLLATAVDGPAATPSGTAAPMSPAPGPGSSDGGQPAPAPGATSPGHTPVPLVPSPLVPTSVPPLLPSLPIVGGLGAGR